MSRGIWRSGRGQSTVEFALILPILALLLLGIMEGGRIFSAYVELQHVAREGARYASLNCTSFAVRDDQVEDWAAITLIPWISTRLSTLDPSELVVSFSRIANLDGTETWVELDISYAMEIQTPVIGDITGNPLNLGSRMVMRTE